MSPDMEALFQDFDECEGCANADKKKKKGVANLILLSVHCSTSHCGAMHRLQLLCHDPEAKNLQAHWGG